MFRRSVQASRVQVSRARRQQKDQGAIAVVAAVALVALIGMAALVVDGGYLAMRRRALQGVADAAALAGGYSLPTSATAISQARANATANGYTNGTNGATVTVNSPYSSDTRRVEVIVQLNVATFLGTALKINSGLVTGRAVAKLDPPAASIFSGSTTCTGGACGQDLCFSGNGNHIQGSLHSNGAVTVSGDSTTSVGAVEYGSGCATHSISGGVVYTSGPTSTATQAYPLSYTLADFTSSCTYSQSSGNFNISTAGSWWQSGNWYSTGVLKPGVYCSTGGGGLQLNGSNISGNVTFVSDGPIQINGQSLNLTAYKNNVWLYTSATTTSSNAIQLGSQDLTWTGAVFAPNGLIAANGTNFNINGSIIGNNIQIGATSWTMTGASGSSVPYLSE